MATGYPSEETVEKAMRSGAKDYLSKFLKTAEFLFQSREERMHFYAKRWWNVLLFVSLVLLAFILTTVAGQAGDPTKSNTSSQDTLTTDTSSQAGNLATHSATPPPVVGVGIFGATLPKKGSLVGHFAAAYGLSAGSLIGTDSVTAAWAVQNVYTTYSPAGVGVPHLVRNDPKDVKIWTMIAGLNYGLTENFAVSVATQYFIKQQNVNVFKGMSGDELLGLASTHSDGIGDTFVTGLYHLYGDRINKINIFFGMSVPTGSTTVTSTAFNNSGVYSIKRAVYTLQLGTGTFDAMPGITYVGVIGRWTWGLSYRSRLPMDTNNQGYRWGNYNEFDGWTGYRLLPGLGTSLRIVGTLQGNIDGYDPQILGYGPCSNPLWFGGDFVDLLPGVSISGRYIGVPRLSMSTAVDLPLYQNLNGLHTARDYAVIISLKYKFF